MGETSSIQSITSSYSEFILNIQKTCNIDVLHQIAKKTVSAKKSKFLDITEVSIVPCSFTNAYPTQLESM